MCKNVHITIACKVFNLHKKRDIELPGGPNNLHASTFNFMTAKITNILTWKSSAKVSVWQNFLFEKGKYRFSHRQWVCLTLIHVSKGLYATELKAFVFY